jgi:hypothetical protein
MAIAIGAAVSVGGVISPWVRHQIALSFTHQPNDFPELYFVSPSTLPSTFVPGRPLTVDVGVGNNSDHSHTYSLLTSINRPGRSDIPLGRTGVTVDAGGSKIAKLSIRLPRHATSLQVALAGHRKVMLLLHLSRGGPNG